MADVFEPRPNGTVLFEWEGREEGLVHRRVLRRPSLTEYEELVGLLGELAGRIEPESPGSGLSATKKWMVAVFVALADQPLPEERELPAWLVAGDVSTDLVRHWQTRPR